ncbi:unnamed protein product [Adineta ricciae]|uniref:WAP domain-containing protein n=1 Tax=Adineta ricciae TaxID=249248 RepID=A0A815WFN7_ADIRI|nr:unnamed protein product [Adineta ricciae]
MMNNVIYLAILILWTLVSVTMSNPTESKLICRDPLLGAFRCKYGNRVNKQGYPICQCKKSPCENEAPILDGYSCGRAVNRNDCPETHYCKIAPTDAYAVCCPRTDLETSTRINKPGECPEQTQPGICIASCTNDSDCGENEKCCGNCPRACTKV